jgi:hypothetical protein
MLILNKLLSLLPMNRIIASMKGSDYKFAHSLNVYISSDKGSADGKTPSQASEEFPSLDAFSFLLQGSMIVIASH